MIDIKWLQEQGPCKKFPKSSSIPCPGGQDSSERAMYILLSGQVEVVRKSALGAGQGTTTLKPGDVFGGREYFAEVDDNFYIVSDDSEVYVITEESFNDLSWSRPEILFDILRAAYKPLWEPDAVEAFATAAVPTSAPAKSPLKAAQQKVEAIKAAAPKPNTSDKSPLKDAQKKIDALKAVPQKESPAPAMAAPAKKTKQASPAANATATPAAAPPDKNESSGTAAAIPAADGEVTVLEGSLFPVGHTSYPGITKPEFAALIFPKDYTCPFCKQEFKDFRVFRSKLFEKQPMRYDLRKYYRDFQTEWYDILTCRSCMFSTFHNYFTDPKPMQKAKIKGKLDEVRTQINMDFEAERDIDFVFTAHYIAILCAEGYPTMMKQLQAKLWGNLSWLYEDISQRALEKFASIRAAEIYEQIYSETRLTPIQEQITLMSIAGMQHRAGIDEGLKKFLFKAKTLEMGDKTYSKLAEDFMYELKIAEEQ